MPFMGICGNPMITLVVCRKRWQTTIAPSPPRHSWESDRRTAPPALWWQPGARGDGSQSSRVKFIVQQCIAASGDSLVAGSPWPRQECCGVLQRIVGEEALRARRCLFLRLFYCSGKRRHGVADCTLLAESPIKRCMYNTCTFGFLCCSLKLCVLIDNPRCASEMRITVG